jgi:hypothetical protein
VRDIRKTRKDTGGVSEGLRRDNTGLSAGADRRRFAGSFNNEIISFYLKYRDIFK